MTRLIFITVAHIVGWLLLSGFRFLKPKKLNSRNEKLSVIIPARNEEINIGKILNCLQRQSTVPEEIIVVDDNSSDNTASIARSFDKVKVVSLRSDPPEGWIGKTWACWNGYLNSTGDLLIFLDADVELREDALETLVAYHQQEKGLVSVWPYQRFERFYEHFNYVFNIIAACSATSFGLLPKSKPVGAFGPVVVTSKADYEKTGGHKAVSKNVVEDLQLGKIYHENGFKLTNLLGGYTIRFRMYPEGLGQMVEGITKNVALGAGKAGLVNLIVLSVWITGVYSSIAAVFQPGSLFFYGLYALQLYFMTKKIGDYTVFDALIYPVHFLFFLVIFAVSLFRTLILKRVKWRGRFIKV